MSTKTIEATLDSQALVPFPKTLTRPLPVHYHQFPMTEPGLSNDSPVSPSREVVSNLVEDLRKRLKTLRAKSGRKELPKRRTELLRRYLDGTWSDILAQHRSQAPGRAVVDALTQRVDTLVSVLFTEAVLDCGGDPPQGYAVLALGGYGRGALNPKSDVDLLFLFRKVERAHPVTRTILHTLWDLRFEIGYSTRTISDCLFASREDPDSLTSMYEARHLVGGRDLSEKLEDALNGQFFGRRARAFIAQKIEERRQRHARAGLSVQLLEPDVKESMGGLRETHAVGWLLKAHGIAAPDGLLETHLLNRRNFGLFQDALDFLLRTRNELHFLTGKRQDVLEHDLQPTAAIGLGYKDQNGELGVERFMRDYYRHARNIKHLSDLICERLHGQPSVAHRAVGFIVRRTLDDGSVLTHSSIGLPRKRKSFFEDNPWRLLSLFLDAQRFGVPINEPTRRRIQDGIHLVDDALRRSRKGAHIFLEILRAPGGVAETLRTMHELGILGAYIPEFDSLTCLVQYNRYHIYTADEHTLLAIEHIERLSTHSSEDGNLAHLKQAFKEIPRKEILYLAVLLHDIGKSVRGSDHSLEGATMAKRFLLRLGLPSEEIDGIVFLIRNHLQMSHISQRRDLSDERMLREFSRSVRHPDLLRMLYLLTYADLSAVTRTAWTAWKAHLLRELHTKTLRLLTQGAPSLEEERRQAASRDLVRAIGDRFEEGEVKTHLNRLPPHYAELNDSENVERHLNLIRKLEKASVAVGFAPSLFFSEVTVCTRDKPYRLSEICGVLSSNDINIFGAQAYTRSDGVVIDIFQVTTLDEASRRIHQRQVQNQLAGVFQEKIRLEELFIRHRRRWSRRRKPSARIPTEVHFENGISDKYTIIDIFAQDAVGLLYRITRTLSDLGLDIDTARVTTQADKAVDSFYALRKGEKIESREMQDPIRKELITRIESSA